MLTTDVRKEIASLWDIVSSAGLAPSPYVALEQIACLIFIRQLHDIDTALSSTGKDPIAQLILEEEKGSRSIKASWWDSIFLAADIGKHLDTVIFPKLRTFEKNHKLSKQNTKPFSLNGLWDDAYFQLDTSKTDALYRLARSIGALFGDDDLENEPKNRGEMFTALLQEASQNSKVGQLSTPPHIGRFMVSLLSPTSSGKIIDPAVGTGSLLVAALEYISENSSPNIQGKINFSDKLFGIDLDHTQTRISWTNLLMHGVKSPMCVQGNSLTTPVSDQPVTGLLNNKYDFVIADLPFGGRVHPDDLKNQTNYFIRQGEKTTKVELLFVMQALEILKNNGRAVLLLPQSVLSGETSAHINLRRWLLLHHQVEAVVTLPGKTFAPFVGINAAILVVRKFKKQRSEVAANAAPLTDTVWFYEISDDGVSTDPRDANPAPPHNDMLDALVHFKNRTKSLDTWESEKDSYFEEINKKHNESKFLDPEQTLSRRATLTKQWQIPVRSWIKDDSHVNINGISGSHDHLGNVFPDYVEHTLTKLYIDGKLQPNILTTDCIESQKWSLEPSRFKTLKQPKALGNDAIIKLIEDLEFIEKSILLDLNDLRMRLGDQK